ncbi:MAG: hypothetical protein HOL77_10725 [Rhodobacteraceae bacterium]|jgi:hypothetical protein|nr:hypothetical protein [Paracoccaceae bacterium]
MTDPVSDGLRRWSLAPKGVVQFGKTSKQMSIAALDCLGSRVSKIVSFEVPPHVLGPNINTHINVTLKIATGQWVGENGAKFDVNLPNIKPRAEVALKNARDLLNTALRRPLDVHMELASIHPAYKTLHANDRPKKSVNLRSWRRADAAWMKKRILVPEASDVPRDAFDRAIELIEKLDRPVMMQWVNFDRLDGGHRIALRVEKQICHPIIALKANGTELLVDRVASLTGVEAQRYVLATHMMALVHALRRYGGLSKGDIEIGAYVVEDFDQTEEGEHILDLWVAANAWGVSVGKTSRMKVETLFSEAPKGIVFEVVGSNPLSAPLDTPEDR